MRNLKKVISSVAALAIVASSASAFAVTFPDVDASASYVNSVNALVGLGIVNGDDNGLFNPDNQVTRAEFTKMAVGALGELAAAEAQTTSQFADAANTSVHWAAGYIAQGVSDGFINGYDDTTFGPDDQVTFAQACKMLVSAIGYTTYAENQGGWPAGYVAQANTLGITSGVSATNDTNLTRAQVATLIYNAMDVPLCVIDSWEATSTMTGVVQTPVLKKLDGKENRDYQTLLTDRHDAYKVKGRVTVTSKGGSASGLEKDEVTYVVESADNYDDILDIPAKNDVQRETMKVGETNAANMLFEYTEALVQVDEDSDEVTILAIEAYGNSKTVTIAADDVADDDSTIGTDYTGEDGRTGGPKLPVYKNESSSSTTKYDLAVKDGEVSAVMYVNGVDAGVVTNDMIDRYILQNDTGVVTLVDVTNTGSTSTDGKYDYIMVDYYIDAVVDTVTTTSTYARIYFKDSQAQMRMQWDPEDEDIDITFSGAVTDYTELQEYDVLSIAYDVVNEDTDLTDNDYYDVKVSRNVVTGTVTSRDAEDNTVRVDGSDYDVIDRIDVVSDIELSTEYTLYLDAFGYVAYKDEGNSDKNYGVIVAMYKSAGNDEYTVRMITSNAEVVAYECKDGTEAKRFYNYAKSGDQNGAAEVVAFTKSTDLEYVLDGNGNKQLVDGIYKNITTGKTVCTYKLSGGKVKFDKAITGYGGADLEYKANSGKLGSYTLAEGTTKLIDMDNYMKPENSGSTVSTLAMSTFEDEATYTAYLFDKNSNGDYRFGIVFGGTSSLRSESTMAIVQKVVGTTDLDGTTCTELTVARDGQEDISVLVEGDNDKSSPAYVEEGSVIAYVIGSDGYVETNSNDGGDLKVIINPSSSYENQKSAILNNDKFAKAVKNANIISSGKYAGFATPAYASTTSKDVVLYYGIVYKKSANNLELFTEKNNKGISTVNDVETFSVSGANQYVYDYGQKAKYRVSVGSQTQAATVFNQAYCTADGYKDAENDKNYVSWADKIYASDTDTKGETNDATPALALVKEVDGDVVDVMYFVAP